MSKIQAHAGVVSDVKLAFSRVQILQFLYETIPLRIKWRKHNLASASNNSAFRSSGGKNKKQQDLTMIQKSTASEDFNSTDIVSKVLRRAGVASQENQQLRLQRRREQKRPRLRETPEQSELRRQAQRRRSQEQKARRVEAEFCQNQQLRLQRPLSMFTCNYFFAS